MNKRKQLTKRQLAVIEGLFNGELDEQAVLDKHNVSRNLYNRWLTDDRFVEQFNVHISRSYRQSELIIARYAPLAAAKLVQLTESDSQETARKACLDIISLPGLASKNTPASTENTVLGPPQSSQLSAETASRLLEVLAEEQQK